MPYIARHPQIALVDELAHTNRPRPAGTDTKRLSRRRGADQTTASTFYTTVNIQMSKALNERRVEQITHIRVREKRCPLHFRSRRRHRARRLTPDDLIQRMKDGKVYVPAQADAALDHYFSPANMTALRELALGEYGRGVDDAAAVDMQAHDIPEVHGGRTSVSGCIQTGRSRAPPASLCDTPNGCRRPLQRQWTALYVETQRQPAAKRGGRDRIADTLRLRPNAWRRTTTSREG